VLVSRLAWTRLRRRENPGSGPKGGPHGNADRAPHGFLHCPFVHPITVLLRVGSRSRIALMVPSVSEDRYPAPFTNRSCGGSLDDDQGEKSDRSTAVVDRLAGSLNACSMASSNASGNSGVTKN
jgi:hypothetical protein